MIVRILSKGKSFKGLASYLTHDPDAETAKRVAWTHTLNLAHDHVPSAVDEMLWTACDAELLKQEAGIRAGGRATENPVKHISLNWSPEEQPTREHMIEAAEGFLDHMDWRTHQAVLVAHDDKAHQHVHIMLSVIDPETGLRLDDDFERRRAQAWALAYEQEQGRIFCEQRLKNPEEREDAPTRDAWMAFQENQKIFDTLENVRRAQADMPENARDPKSANFAEWKILKEIQKHERLDFFAEGKAAFSELRHEIYREVRGEFRERWADYYAARRDGGDDDTLAEMKAKLLAEQRELLAARRDEACAELRVSRDETYRDLLDDQRDSRLGLRMRQEAGFENGLYLDLVRERAEERTAAVLFREAAREVTEPQREADGSFAPAPASPREPDAHMKSGTDVGASIATGLGFGVLSIFDSIADGIIGATPAPKQDNDNAFDAAAAEAERRRRSDQDEEDWRKRQGIPRGD